MADDNYQRMLVETAALSALVDSIRDFLLVHDSEGRIERINRSLAQMTMLPTSELAGQFCRDVLPGGGENWQRCPFCESAGTGEEFDPNFGGHYLVSTSHVENSSSVVHVVRDVSARKTAEDRYRNLFQNVREGVFISTPAGHMLDCNEALARMLGYSREELLRVHIPSVLWADSADRQRQIDTMDRQGYVEDYEIHLRKRTGEEVVVLESSFATRNSAGKVVSYQGFLVDVTARQQMEQELQRQNEMLSRVNNLTSRMTHRLDRDAVLTTVVVEVRRLFHFDAVAVYMVDETTGIANRIAAAGYRTELGQRLPQLQTSPQTMAALRNATTTLVPLAELGILAPELRKVQAAEGIRSVFIMPLQGEHLLGAISFSNRQERVLSVAEETLLAAISRQLNDVLANIMLYEESKNAYESLRRAQEQLLQSEKMAAVGQLVSGVAHELNNPLAAIIGYSQLLSSHVSTKGEDYLEKLMRQAKRTQKIIQDLLSFSRQRKPERKALDLNSIVDEALLLRDYDMRTSNVRVIRHLDAALPPVMGDRHQLEQVCLNIINNACDAILENAGTGTLEVRSYLAENTRYVVLEFLDDGAGMKEPNRVFEPFYTTKKVGMGTGLGLSICYGLLKQQGGEIEAVARQPHGAIFRVRLPAARAEDVEASASAATN